MDSFLTGGLDEVVALIGGEALQMGLGVGVFLAPAVDGLVGRAELLGNILPGASGFDGGHRSQLLLKREGPSLGHRDHLLPSSAGGAFIA